LLPSKLIALPNLPSFTRSGELGASAKGFDPSRNTASGAPDISFLSTPSSKASSNLKYESGIGPAWSRIGAASGARSTTRTPRMPAIFIFLLTRMFLLMMGAEAPSQMKPTSHGPTVIKTHQARFGPMRIITSLSATAWRCTNAEAIPNDTSITTAIRQRLFFAVPVACDCLGRFLTIVLHQVMFFR